jgi:XrtN system VIT domain protein
MGNLSISKTERIKILQSKFDARHVAQRKLWSGKSLLTTDVLTNIQVFPDYRLAYTEKIITIKNNNKRRWRGRQQEAVYTFHLPEGSVASSMSLWINGVEEKSRLTTKEKADSAYVSIVGVERRDPALLHWQEGNTIVVTVFPCTTEEDRIFKVGITTPLKKENNRLVLKNIYFEGPDIINTKETTVINFVTNNDLDEIDLPSGFASTGINKFQYSGNYKPYWEVKCSSTPLSKNKFAFNNKSFHIEELKKKVEKFESKKVYLDINKNWSKPEFNEVWGLVKEKEVFAFDDKMFKLTDKNRSYIFEALVNQNFSLFPIHKINKPEEALFISKSGTVSPNLSDIKDSKFAGELKNYLKNEKHTIRFFNLSEDISPYLKGLKEFRVFNYKKGNINELTTLINTGQFPKDIESDNIIALDNAKSIIVMDNANATSKAPDHLMRLFAYNQIMRKTGRNYFNKKGYVTDELIGIANEAYIVSPISSLIVLETLKDYNRFNIEENKNSLKNASVNSSGSAPEPHEWALIALTVISLIFITYKRYV